MAINRSGSSPSPDGVTFGGYSYLFDGKRCKLVNIGPEHYEMLRQMEVVQLGLWWRNRGALASPQQFAARIWDACAFQCLAVGAADGKVLLWLQCYEADPANGVANLAVARLGEQFLNPRSASGVAAFIEYCFEAMSLRKLYMEVAGPNLPMFERAVGPLFIEEGRLLDHIQGPDGTVHLHILSLSRERWSLSPLRRHLLDRF